MNPHELRNLRLLACLGEPSRFRLVGLLATGEQCVSDLARAVRLSQSCTTRHLQALERAGLIERKREGKRVLFRVRSERPEVESLIAWALAVDSTASSTSDPLVIEGASLHRGVESGALAGFDSWRPRPRRRAKTTGPRRKNEADIISNRNERTRPSAMMEADMLESSWPSYRRESKQGAEIDAQGPGGSSSLPDSEEGKSKAAKSRVLVPIVPASEDSIDPDGGGGIVRGREDGPHEPADEIEDFLL